MAGTQDISFVQSQFDELVARRGKIVQWQQAFQCSCWTVQQGGSGEPLYNCQACGGTGYIYQPPVTARIVLQGINIKRDFIPMGAWQEGDVTASIPNMMQVQTPGPTGTIITWTPHPMWTIAVGDLVSLTDSEQRSSMVMTRGQQTYKWAPDTLPYPAGAILQVISLLVSDPVGGGVTTFAQGVAGTDYTVSGSTVTWNTSSTADYMLNGNVFVFNPNGTNAKNLATGTQYSVNFTHYATYTVYQDFPEPRDQDGQHMPRKVMLRLKGVGT